MIELGGIQEELDPGPTQIVADAISLAVNSVHYVQHKLFRDLFVETPAGRSPRLRVTRFYWDLDRPVVVDFMKEIRYGKLEITRKKEYFEGQAITYVLAQDVWDGEGVEEQLFAAVAPEGQQQVVQNAAKLLVAPRHRVTQSHEEGL